jgi:hypothetical protein
MCAVLKKDIREKKKPNGFLSLLFSIFSLLIGHVDRYAVSKEMTLRVQHGQYNMKL